MDQSNPGDLADAAHLGFARRLVAHSVNENGQAMEITVTFLSDGNTRYFFRDPRGRTAKDTGTWQYSDGILFERFSNGASGRGSIRWIDDNTVELTIIDNGVPAYAGMKRTYRRVS